MKDLLTYILEQHNNDIKAFTIIKPEFLDHRDEINDYIVSNGFDNIDHIETTLTQQQAKSLYKVHCDEEWFNDLCKYMSSGPAEFAIWSYDNNANPCTNTIKLMKDIKHHFRDKYGKDEMRNCMHSSDSLKHVQQESKIIFN